MKIGLLRVLREVTRALNSPGETESKVVEINKTVGSDILNGRVGVPNATFT